MKTFKSWTKMKKYFDDLLDDLGATIRTHNCDLPSNVSTLEYLYVAMGEATAGKNVFGADYLCDKFTFRDIIETIVRKDPSDIIAFAAIFKAFRYNPNKSGATWGFNPDRGCKYIKTIRETYDQLCHAVMPVVVRELRECEDGNPKINLSPFFNDIYVTVTAPYRDSDGDVTNITYDIYPFNGVLEVVSNEWYPKMWWTDGLYNKLWASAYKLAGIYDGTKAIDDVPKLNAAYRCVHSASVIVDKAVDCGAHGHHVGFPMGFATVLQQVPIDGFSKIFQHYNYDPEYCYDNFLGDVLLMEEPGVWMIGVMYILSTLDAREGWTQCAHAGFAQMREPSRREKYVNIWKKCCDLFTHSYNVAETLAKLEVIVPVKYGDYHGTVNLTEGDYEITVTYRGSF